MFFLNLITYLRNWLEPRLCAFFTTGESSCVCSKYIVIVIFIDNLIHLRRGKRWFDRDRITIELIPLDEKQKICGFFQFDRS